MRRTSGKDEKVQKSCVRGHGRILVANRTGFVGCIRNLIIFDGICFAVFSFYVTFAGNINKNVISIKQ